MFLHVFDSGFRPTNHTTQYDDSSRSRHVTTWKKVTNKTTIMTAQPAHSATSDKTLDTTGDSNVRARKPS